MCCGGYTALCLELAHFLVWVSFLLSAKPPSQSGDTHDEPPLLSLALFVEPAPVFAFYYVLPLLNNKMNMLKHSNYMHENGMKS